MILVCSYFSCIMKTRKKISFISAIIWKSLVIVISFYLFIVFYYGPQHSTTQHTPTTEYEKYKAVADFLHSHKFLLIYGRFGVFALGIFILSFFVSIFIAVLSSAFPPRSFFRRVFRFERNKTKKMKNEKLCIILLI